MIEVKNVIHQYKRDSEHQIMALNDISLTVQEGEFLVIIGHNGSGKSTLAKHFNSLLIPTSGEVLVDGMLTSDWDHVWDIRTRVGMVFQNPDNQLIATTVEEDVAFGPENLGLDPATIRSRVDEALDKVGMGGFQKREPHYLSGGQKQRVAIAGVIAMRPEYMVLDEPTAMLDPKGRREVMNTVRHLNKNEGLTIIHITHYMEEAIGADRVIVMEEGKKMLEGTPQEIFRQVELLKHLRMDVPPMAELAYRLQKKGLNIVGDVLTVDEMVSKLC